MLAWNSLCNTGWPSVWSLLNAGIMGVNHHTQLVVQTFNKEKKAWLSPSSNKFLFSGLQSQSLSSQPLFVDDSSTPRLLPTHLGTLLVGLYSVTSLKEHRKGTEDLFCIDGRDYSSDSVLHCCARDIKYPWWSVLKAFSVSWDHHGKGKRSSLLMKKRMM